MFTPYIISKELVAPRISEIDERNKARKEKKINKCYRRQMTDLTTASDLTAISAAASFTPYIVSKEHTEPIKAELEEDREQRKRKNAKKQQRRRSSGIMKEDIPKQAKFVPYITSNRHVAASLS